MIAAHPEAQRQFGLDIEHLAERILAPPSDLTLVQWSEANRTLPGKGNYRIEQVPYLREPMEAFTDPLVKEMVLLKSSRLGVTEGLINNAIGFVIDQAPGNILAVWPTKEDAQEWSKEAVTALFESTPCLRGKVADVALRGPDNAMLFKRFAGGFLSAIGSNSPRALRRRNARYVFVDELDALDDKESTREGDVGRRAARRADAEPEGKVLFTGSPRLGRNGRSRIITAFDSTDQRHFHVPCPRCGALQELLWSGLHWEKDKDPKSAKTLRHYPETAYYRCVHCEGRIEQGRDKLEMVRAGSYVAHKAGETKPGWKITTLYSLFVEWTQLAEEWIASKRALESGDAEKRVEFLQQVLAEPWTGPKLEKPDPKALSARRELFPSEVPAGVGVLTAAVDVQGDRLELLVKGWGIAQESWDIGHWRIYGDPETADVWSRLDLLLFKQFQHELGAELRVQCTLVDSGHLAECVYRYCRRRHRLKVYPSKGEPTKPGSPLIWRSTSSKAQAERLWHVDDARLMRTVLYRLRIEQPGPGYIHFPGPGNDGLDDEYLKQFENDIVIERKLPNGSKVPERKQLGPNEAPDLQKYALAALHVLGDAVVNNLAVHVARVAELGRLRGGRRVAALQPGAPPERPHVKALRSRVRSAGVPR